jgi:hypothetical protein
MGLDKSIEHKKEKRRPYRGSKSIARSCRNRGGCPFCEDGRLYQRRKLEDVASEEVAESVE